MSKHRSKGHADSVNKRLRGEAKEKFLARNPSEGEIHAWIAGFNMSHKAKLKYERNLIRDNFGDEFEDISLKQILETLRAERL